MRSVRKASPHSVTFISSMSGPGNLSHAVLELNIASIFSVASGHRIHTYMYISEVRDMKCEKSLLYHAHFFSILIHFTKMWACVRTKTVAGWLWGYNRVSRNSLSNPKASSTKCANKVSSYCTMGNSEWSFSTASCTRARINSTCRYTVINNQEYKTNSCIKY